MTAKQIDPLVAQLRAIRREHGLSLQQVAERMGRASYQSVWQWESGASEPRVGNLREWAAALGYDLALSYGLTSVVRVGGS